MSTLALPQARNANRLPYTAIPNEAGSWYVQGPTPRNPNHTWPTTARQEDAEALADSLNAAWQCGRRTGAQDVSIATYKQ